MNNFFKKRKNTIDPSKEGVIEFILSLDNSNPHVKNGPKFLEVKRSIDVIPEWFKDLPPLVEIKGSPDLSLKKCIPFLDAISTGYYLVTTKDYEFYADESKQEYKISGDIESSLKSDFPILKHPIDQIGNMPIDDNYIKYAFKWNNQYIVKTPPGYSTLFIHPMNFPDLPFYSLSGVVDTDNFFMSVLFPFFIKKGFSGKIPAGTPVIQIIPFKRDDWKHSVDNSPSKALKHHIAETMDKYMKDRFEPGNPIPVGGIYKKRFRKQKKYL
jgi:hypothetical protein